MHVPIRLEFSSMPNATSQLMLRFSAAGLEEAKLFFYYVPCEGKLKRRCSFPFAGIFKFSDFMSSVKVGGTETSNLSINPVITPNFTIYHTSSALLHYKDFIHRHTLTRTHKLQQGFFRTPNLYQFTNTREINDKTQIFLRIHTSQFVWKRWTFFGTRKEWNEAEFGETF